MLRLVIKQLFTSTKLIKINKDNNNIYQQRQKKQDKTLSTTMQFSKLSLKDFALLTKAQNLGKNTDSIYWHQVGQEFLERLQPTSNPEKIRSFSVVLYHLSKVKADIMASNFQVTFSLMLPFASPQSFASIVSSLSRLGGFSNQFSMIVRKNYENKKHELGIREKIAINYSMTRNGDKMDESLLQHFQQMNLKQIMTTLNMANQCDLITQSVLKKASHHYILRKKQINILDFSMGLQIFGKHQYLTKQVVESMSYAYSFIKRNMDAGAMQRVWKYFPQLINQNLLTIELTQQIILSMKILYKKHQLSDEFVRQVRRDLKKINNIEVRIRCELK